jgi:hypothetical protein
MKQILLLLILFTSIAHARDLDGRYAQSPLKTWFDKLRSSGGSLCCSDADGTALSDVDWDAAGGPLPRQDRWRMDSSS